MNNSTNKRKAESIQTSKKSYEIGKSDTKSNSNQSKTESNPEKLDQETDIIATINPKDTQLSDSKIIMEANEKKFKPKLKQAKLEFFNIKVESKNPVRIFEEPPKGKEIRIYSWNVNGIRAVIDKGYFDFFIKQEDPDILCLNETKINLETLEKTKIDKLYKEKYLSFWNCSEEKNGYSGVCILSKYKPIRVTNGMRIEKHDGEGSYFFFNLRKNDHN